MKKKVNTATAVLCLGFVAVMIFCTLFSGRKKESFIENRSLSPLPSVSFGGLYSGETFRQLNNHYTDHFAGRSLWTSVKAEMQSQLSESIVNGVYVSRDRLLDTDISRREPDYSSADFINSFCAEYDGTAYIVAVPSSSGIYGSILPEHIAINPESQQISGLYDKLGNDVRKIDAHNILKMIKESYIYYRNDTKWTTYGAYCVYRTVIKKLGFQPTPYDKYTIEHITDSFRGNLYNRSLSKKPKADIIDIYRYNDGAKVLSCICTDKDGNIYQGEIFDRRRLKSSDMYSVYLGDPVPVMKIKTSAKSDKKLLVIKDSYADCFIPFLFQHYSEITVVTPSEMNSSLSEIVNINDYGQTLFLFGVEDLNSSSSLEKLTERK